MHSFRCTEDEQRESEYQLSAMRRFVTASRVIKPSRVTVRVVLILKTLLKGLSAHQTLDKRSGDEKGRSVLSADREIGGRFSWSVNISIK